MQLELDVNNGVIRDSVPDNPFNAFKLVLSSWVLLLLIDQVPTE
jgi:hypothetical protein